MIEQRSGDGCAPLQRLLLGHDGTLTELIGALMQEPLGLVKLEHRVATADAPIPVLELEAGDPLIQRRVLLRGSRSGTVYVHADAHLAAARLPAALRDALEQTDIPLGRLMRQHRLEVFQEPLGWQCREAAALATRFPDCRDDDRVIFRRYRAFSGGRPALLIDESFSPLLWRLLAGELRAIDLPLRPDSRPACAA